MGGTSTVDLVVNKMALVKTETPLLLFSKTKKQKKKHLQWIASIALDLFPTLPSQKLPLNATIVSAFVNAANDTQGERSEVSRGDTLYNA